MAFNGLRLEYALEGSSNYIAWKDRMEAVLEDNGLKEFIDNDIPKPAAANAEGCKCEDNLTGGSTRQHCIKYPSQSDTICNVESFDRSISDQQ